jgi:hypothetical protein
MRDQAWPLADRCDAGYRRGLLAYSVQAGDARFGQRYETALRIGLHVRFIVADLAAAIDRFPKSQLKLLGAVLGAYSGERDRSFRRT